MVMRPRFPCVYRVRWSVCLSLGASLGVWLRVAVCADRVCVRVCLHRSVSDSVCARVAGVEAVN